MQTQDRMEISAVTESTDRNCMFIILGENLHQIRKVWLWTPDDVEIEDLEMENAPLPEAPPEDAVEGMLMGKPDCPFAAACGIGKSPTDIRCFLRYYGWRVKPDSALHG